MADVSIVNEAVASTPVGYKVPGAQEILLKAAGCTVNGSGATGPFLPALQMLDPAGHVMWTAVNDSLPVAVGGSALVSWFPGGGIDSAGASSTAKGTIETITSSGTTITVTAPSGPTTNLDLPATGVTPGSYGDGGHVPDLTVDAEGRITGVTAVPISGGSSTVGFEIGYTQITSSVTITSTTEASGTTVISCPAFTFDGGIVLCQFFCPQAVMGTSGFFEVSLFEGATQIGRLCIVQSVTAGSSSANFPITGMLRFTPSAASHTYTVTAFKAAAGTTAALDCGAGGTGTVVPAFVRFTKV